MVSVIVVTRVMVVNIIVLMMLNVNYYRIILD